MRFLELENIEGTKFKLNLNLVASFALAKAEPDSLHYGTLHISAVGINYHVKKESAQLFLAAVENDILLPPAVDCPPVKIGLVPPTKEE